MVLMKITATTIAASTLCMAWVKLLYMLLLLISFTPITLPYFHVNGHVFLKKNKENAKVIKIL